MQQQGYDDLSGLFERATRGGVILDGYALCGPGCGEPGPDWSCSNQRACTDRECACHLFSRANDDSPQDPDSWKHEKGPGEPETPRAGRVYRCFCVRKA